MIAVLEPAIHRDSQSATKASVIIVTHNSRDDVARCIQSLHQDRADYEIVVVDNASSDDCGEYVTQNFPNVRVIRNPVNSGYGGGNNVGARVARGEVLVFLNPDTIVQPGWCAALVEALGEPDVGLATAMILLRDDPTRVNAFGNQMHVSGLTECRGLGDHRDAYTSVEDVTAVSGAAFAIRRDVFEDLGGFDEDFFLYLDDTDLSMRARLAGYRCVGVPSSAVYHKYAHRWCPEKTYLLERNRYLLLLKCFQWRTLLVLFPALVLAEIVTWGFVVLRGRRWLGVKLRAYAWIVRHWPTVMRARRRTQALRRVSDRDLIAHGTYRLAYEQVVNGACNWIAHAVFDPLFWLIYRVALALTHLSR